MLLLTFTRAFNEFLYEFLGIFLILENSLKFANFFAEVTNSRSMDTTEIIHHAASKVVSKLHTVTNAACNIVQ